MKRGRHKSLGNDLERSVKWIESFDIIRKVVLGRTESCRHAYSPGHIRFQKQTKAGIKVKGYSGNGVVDIFLVISPEDQEQFKKAFERRF